MICFWYDTVKKRWLPLPAEKLSFLYIQWWAYMDAICKECLRILKLGSRDGAVVAQWWEHSPPTNVSRVRFPDPTSYYVGWVCCWFSSLLREVFLWVLRFFLSSKKQHFQIPILAWESVPIWFDLILKISGTSSHGRRTNSIPGLSPRLEEGRVGKAPGNEVGQRDGLPGFVSNPEIKSSTTLVIK